MPVIKHANAHYVFVSRNGEQLKALRKLIEAEKITPPSIEKMALKDAGQAQEKLPNGTVLGKLVLKFI